MHLATEFEEPSDDFDTKYPLTPPPSDYSESRPISPQRIIQADSHVLTIRVPTMKCRNLPPKSGAVRHMEHGASANLDASAKLKVCTTSAFDFVSPSQLTLCLMSRKSSKPAIASVAQALVSSAKQKQWTKSKHVKADVFTLSVDELEGLLECTLSI
ncbi:hypothetical protein C0993_000631 [Termitomyces sp. T159_Od127]|nr:hypothetical protein C0993_000631 [Termitomyces sp. T159_Od127]